MLFYDGLQEVTGLFFFLSELVMGVQIRKRVMAKQKQVTEIKAISVSVKE